MNAKRSFGVTLLALTFAPGAATADPWKDESGKQREGAKNFFKQQEKLREQQEKFLEKRQERLEERREEGKERYEEAFEEQEERREEYREAIEERRERAEERAEEWRDERAPVYSPLRQGNDRQRYDGYGRGQFAYDGYGYEDNGYYREPHHYDGYGYDHDGYGNRGYVLSPVPYQSYVEPQRPYYPPRQDAGSTSVYTPFGFYQEYDGPTYGYGPRPEARGQIGPFQFEVWED